MAITYYDRGAVRMSFDVMQTQPMVVVVADVASKGGPGGPPGSE